MPTPSLRHAFALAAALLANATMPAIAADIVLTPPVAGGVAVTNAAGTTTRLRMADDGTFTLPGLAPLPGAGSGLCLDIATGRVGTCSLGALTSITAGTGLTGGTITTSGTIAADTAYLQRRVGGTCPAGSSIRAIAADGTVTCQVDTTGNLANAFVQGGNAFGAAATLGTTDNQPMQFVANGVTALRLLPHPLSPSVVAGHPVNAVTAGVGAATVAGGGSTYSGFPLPSDQATGIICTRNCSNTVTDHGGTIGGGVDNLAGNNNEFLADAPYATVAGGMHNSAGAQGSTVGGGFTNSADGLYSVVAGGGSNLAPGHRSVVAGGEFNQANGEGSFVAGGESNQANGANSFAAGRSARADHVGSFVWGQSTAGPMHQAFASATDYEFAVKAQGGFRVVTQMVQATGAPFDQAGTFRLLPSGRLELPAFTGAIYRGTQPFLLASSTGNLFAGLSAGNETNSGAGNNTGVGGGSLQALSTGYENAALGQAALAGNTTGAGNSGVGYRALAANSANFNNTAVGAQALANATGGGNTALGAFAGLNLVTGNGNLLIANSGADGESDTTRIGSSQSRVFITGIRGVTTGANNATTVVIDGNGQLGTISSSRRFKDDIADMGEASDILMRLRPVTFRYKSHAASGQAARQYGLVAEEVAAVAPELAVHGADGQVETVNYHLLVPMLLNELQKQQRTIEEQAARLSRLEARLGAQ